MPNLIVSSKEAGDGLFALTEGEVIVGRGNDVGLLLPNVSVSREHVRFTVTRGEVCIEDLESRNGTLVNGERVESHVLTSGDEIQVGKYVLTFIGDERSHQFHRGRYIGYMRAYEPRQVYTEDSTFAISPQQLQRMQREQAIIRESKVVLVSNPSKFWYPEDRSISFGSEGMIPVDGMFTSGMVAEVSWDGRQHVIHKHARMTKVLVNEQPVTDQPLRRGDRIRIGNTRFRYESVED